MFNLKEMAREASTHNLESAGNTGDAVASFSDGYEAGFNEAQIEQGFAVVEEANNDMNTLVEARAMVETNLENGDVTPELGEAYRATMLRMEGKYGINGLADANLESADAVKGFLKNLAANAAKIIAQIVAMAKKTWLKFSAWVATSDAKVKEFTKKLTKLKEAVTKENKVLYISSEEAAKKQLRTSIELMSLALPLGDEDTLNKITVTEISKSLKDAFTISNNASTISPEGKIDLPEINLSDNVEFQNEKDNHLAKDSGTKMYLCGSDLKKVTILMVNDSYTPEDSDSDPVYTARIVSISREADIEAIIDKELTDMVKGHDFSNGGMYRTKAESIADIELAEVTLKDLPKASAVQTTIKNGFKDLDKMSKAVSKEFGKPDDWEGKGKQAMAKKDAYVAGSKAVYATIKTGLAAYRLSIVFVDSVVRCPLKKAK